MNPKFSVMVLMSIIALGTLPAGTLALPDDHIVTLDIYDDPTDPNSKVVFTIELFLTADSETSGELGTDGEVGWDITSIQLTQYEAAGDRVWVENTPVVDTSDGLWWVYHANTKTPADDEFLMPPYTYGLALAQDPQDQDLAYEFEGKEYTGSNPPFGNNTAAMVYRMAEEEDGTPVESSEGEDEPVTSSGVRDPD